MPKSMTGYGSAEAQDERWTQIWEIRSVNGKQLSIRWKLPSFLFPQQAEWERLLRTRAGRGRVDVSLTLSANTAEDLGLELNRPLALAMFDRLRSLAAETGESFHPDFNRLLPIQSLWGESMQRPDETLLETLARGLEKALADWDESRIREGDALTVDLGSRVAVLFSSLERLRTLAPRVKEERFATVQERITELLDQAGADLDQSRMLHEVAFLSDKLDVSEEITRLQSHLEQIKALLCEPGECGRRLDFLLQECFREINTCGNKIQDLEASRIVVDFKVELEKCREQVQNLE
ncbi:MAG: YicC/YloC family endoribonuclease [Desulfovibrionales bacterium]